MTKKVKKGFVLSLAVASLTLFGSIPAFASDAEVPEESNELLIWAHIDSYIQDCISGFEAAYPEYEGHVQYEITDTHDLIQKYQQTRASGGQLPDVLFLDLMDAGAVVTSSQAKDLLYDMSAEPFNYDTSQLVDWVADLYSDEEGGFYGFEIGPAPSTFLVKKDMAEKYLGTIDPVEISDQLASWEDVLELGRKIKEESGGTDHLAVNLNELVGILKQNSQGTFDGSTCNIMEQWKDEFEILATMAQEDLVDNLEAEGPEIPGAMTDGHYLLWQCAMWQPVWTYMEGAPDAAGEWIMLPTPPGGKMFVGGGMPLTVPKGAVNPIGGYKFLSWLRGSLEGNAFCRDSFGDVADVKAAYEDPEFHTSSQETIDYFGVDVVAQFAKYMDQTEVLETTPYDTVLWNDGIKIAFQALESGSTAEEGLQALIDELMRVYPEITQK